MALMTTSITLHCVKPFANAHKQGGWDMVALGYDRALPCTDTPAYVWQGGTAGDDQARAMLLSSAVPNSVAAAGSNVGVVIAGFSQGAFAGPSYGGVDTVLGDAAMIQVTVFPVLIPTVLFRRLFRNVLHFLHACSSMCT
jgi:hypothetical protein